MMNQPTHVCRDFLAAGGNYNDAEGIITKPAFVKVFVARDERRMLQGPQERDDLVIFHSRTPHIKTDLPGAYSPASQ